MPVYEYACKKCQKAFTVVLSLREHEQGPVACPACGARDVQQLISQFIAKTVSKT